MGVATFTSRSIGFVRVWVIARVLGTTFLGNTYQSSNSVSNVLFELLAAGALSAVLVPTFARHLSSGGEQARGRTSGRRDDGHRAVGDGRSHRDRHRVRSRRSPACSPSGRRDPEIARAAGRAVDVPPVLLHPQVCSTVRDRRHRGAVRQAPVRRSPRLAPIANTVFARRAAARLPGAWHGPDPGSTSPHREAPARLGGDSACLAFVGVPAVRSRTGFRFRPGSAPAIQQLRQLLWLSAWAVFQHRRGGAARAAIVMGNQVAGGTWSPTSSRSCSSSPRTRSWPSRCRPRRYRARSMPTAATTASLRRRLRWALDSMAMLMLPRVRRVHRARRARDACDLVRCQQDGSTCYAAALASLGLGLFFYSSFLLFARCSRTRWATAARRR